MSYHNISYSLELREMGSELRDRAEIWQAHWQQAPVKFQSDLIFQTAPKPVASRLCEISWSFRRYSPALPSEQSLVSAEYDWHFHNPAFRSWFPWQPPLPSQPWPKTEAPTIRPTWHAFLTLIGRHELCHKYLWWSAYRSYCTLCILWRYAAGEEYIYHIGQKNDLFQLACMESCCKIICLYGCE